MYRTTLLAAACAIAAATASQPLLAQGKGPGGYPVKPVRFVVPFAPGGTTDVIARLVSHRLSEELGQTLLVDNRAGAGGTIAAELVSRAPADGYTLMFNHQGMAFNVTLYPKLPFDTARDFTSIAMIGTTPNVLVVNNAVPAKSVKELISLAREREISFGSGGIGSSSHLAVEFFMQLTGLKVLHVPYKGAGPALTDTMGGQVQMMIVTMPGAAGFIRGGKLRALAVSGAKRSPAFPDLPTIAEAGVTGYAYDTWYALFGPAKLPPALVQWLNKVTNRVLTEPALRDKLADIGLEVETMTPEALHKLLLADIVRWGKLIREANITIQ
jgi:tripartite-type tricarboxylate transporter receptor subunit TctC